MRKFFGFFFGYGSSFVYLGVAYWLLMFQPDFESGMTAIRITTYALVFFMFSQAALVQLLKGQEETKGMIDLVLSMVVVFGLILLPIFSNTGEILIWLDIYILFLFGGLFDLVINNRMILRMFRMSTGIANEG